MHRFRSTVHVGSAFKSALYYPVRHSYNSSFHMAISITFIAMLSDAVGKVFLLLNRILFRARLVIVTSSNPPVLSFHQLMEGCHLKKKLCQYKCTEGGKMAFNSPKSCLLIILHTFYSCTHV